MRKVILSCDCCGKEMSDHWEETGNYLKINSAQSCRNPLKEISKDKDSTFQNVQIEIEDICYVCIRKINNRIVEIFKELSPDLSQSNEESKSI